LSGFYPDTIDLGGIADIGVSWGLGLCLQWEPGPQPLVRECGEAQSFSLLK